MSSQRGNAARSRPQKHKNTSAFRNDKYGATIQVQKAKSKVHEGLCQRCKEVLEWKVKYNKYKPITQARTCVKCSQKTVKDAYHVICKPCATKLELCAKCGKKEDLAVPVNPQMEGEGEDTSQEEKKGGYQKKKAKDLDSDDDFPDSGSDYDDDNDDDEDDDSCDDEKDLPGNSTPQVAGVTAAVPDISCVRVKD